MLGRLFKPKKEAPPPIDIGHYKRFNDAVFVASQDNSARRLPITACNEKAIKLTGYSADEIKTLDLRDLLPQEIREIVDDYLEFEDDGRKIDEILLKLANFKILASRGREIPAKVRVLTDVSTLQKQNYQIVVSDISLAEMLSERRKNRVRIAAENTITDLKTGLPTKDSLLFDVELVLEHGKNIGFVSSFATIKFGEGNNNIKRAGKMLDVLKRDSDIIGVWADDVLVFVLPDTPLDNAKTPLLRLKGSLPDDLKNMQITLCEINDAAPFTDQVELALSGQSGVTI